MHSDRTISKAALLTLLAQMHSANKAAPLATSAVSSSPSEAFALSMLRTAELVEIYTRRLSRRQVPASAFGAENFLTELAEYPEVEIAMLSIEADQRITTVWLAADLGRVVGCISGADARLS